MATPSLGKMDYKTASIRKQQLKDDIEFGRKTQ